MINNHYEEVQPLYLNKDKVMKTPRIIFRTFLGSNRYYYYFDDNGSMIKNPSVTSIIESEMRQPEWLIKWIAEWGYRKAIEKRDQAAMYGTFFSILSAQYLKDKRFDLETIKPRLEIFIQQQNIDFPTDNWEYRLREDLYALHQFIIDYNVEPIAVEIMLASKEGFAGAIDAVVEMTVGSGVNMRILKSDRKIDKKSGELIEDKTRRVTAVIDWKSGRHGFYKNNAAQLHMYKMLWEENFPHIPIDCLFNWSPKDWSVDGSLYNLKEQSDSNERYKVMNYVKNFHIDHQEDNDKVYKHIHGVLEIGHQNGNLQFETFEERAKRIHKVDTCMKEIEEPEPTGEDFLTQGTNKSKELLPKALKNHETNNISLINTIEEVINGK